MSSAASQRKFFVRSERPALEADPMGHVDELMFVSLVGIIDPLRPEAVDAVATAHSAGIEVRMITGDHAITAKAIADDLDLGPGVITGPDFQKLTDDEVRDRLPELHVFGRVAPEDKVRLASLIQDTGQVVAMTGDAVNDAAALKQADIGVAMGSGSEVSKQAAKMILTDDNFATLVHAVELGRDIYDKVKAYIAYQLAGMFGLLALMLAASAFNINSGVALTPGMILYISLFITIFPVLAIMGDTADPGLMDRKPRDPAVPVFNRTTGTRWVITGLVLAAFALIPLIWGPDEPKIDGPSISMTMTFAISCLATVGIGVVSRRYPGGFWEGPATPYFLWMGLAAVITWLGVELPLLQRMLDTVSLTGEQWLGVIALSLAAPVLVEAEKWWQRRRLSSVSA